MNKICYYITYYFFYSWMYLHALLPFRILYILSDILYVLVYKIIGYRVKVVRKNFQNSFPHKTSDERRIIERQFYHHFCDYLVETIKVLHISEKEAERRIIFKNAELVKELMKDGNSCLMFLGHYCNWEWVPAITRHFKDGEILCQIYRPLKNKAVDDIFLKIRSRFGSFGIPKEKTLREIIQRNREGEKLLVGFMSDQTPSVMNIHYWTQFLNQDTPAYTGVERIAKKMDFSVVYLDIKKIKRGYYECEVKLITDKPIGEEPFAITEMYFREMEKTILRDPAYWLWTHKRWKFTREQVAEILSKHE